MTLSGFPPGYSVRRMVAEDLDQVLALEQRVYKFPWSRQNFQSCLTANYEGWLLYSENRLLGYAIISVAAGESHLLNISIDSCCQRQGLGRKLLRFILARAKQKQATVTFLEVRVSNVNAFQLYQSEGFNEIGVRKGYYPAGKTREDALVLAINL